MAENSKIEWTDHTFNPWIGCTKISDGCKFCYAETMMDHHYRKVKWGPQGRRVKTSESYWRKPIQWERASFVECTECGFRGKDLGQIHCPGCMYYTGNVWEPARQRVFCASLADVFEDNPQVADWRSELLDLITATPNLDWLLLTKRPENVNSFSHYALPDNVWIGTSIESQKAADERIPALMKVKANVRFLSCEPLLGPINIQGYLLAGWHKFEPKIRWVIAGGESGPHARPMDPKWAETLRDQCQEAGTPFLFKQWGEWHHDGDVLLERPNTPVYFTDSMSVPMYRVGKSKAGRLLDGREWNEYPKAESWPSQ